MGTADESEKARVETEVLNVTALLEDTTARRTRAYEEMTRKPASTFLQQQFDKLDREVGALEKKSAELKDKLLVLTAESESASKAQGEIVSLIDQLGKLTGDEAFRVRAALSARVREIVSKVGVHLGSRKKGDNTVPKDRAFRVVLKSGADVEMGVYVRPSPNDPTTFDMLSDGDKRNNIITGTLIRELLEHYGVANPTSAQIGEMTSDLLSIATTREWLFPSVEVWLPLVKELGKWGTPTVEETE
jgi:hypothetical protein